MYLTVQFLMSVLGSASLLVSCCCANWAPSCLWAVIRTGKQEHLWASVWGIRRNQPPVVFMWSPWAGQRRCHQASDSKFSREVVLLVLLPTDFGVKPSAALPPGSSSSMSLLPFSFQPKKKNSIYALKFQFLTGNSNWSPTQLWLIARYIKYCVVKLNLENKLLSAPR